MCVCVCVCVCNCNHWVGGREGGGVSFNNAATYLALVTN